MGEHHNKIMFDRARNRKLGVGKWKKIGGGVGGFQKVAKSGNTEK